MKWFICFFSVSLLFSLGSCEKRIEKKFVGNYEGHYVFQDGYFIETGPEPYWQEVVTEGDEMHTVYRDGDWLMVEGYGFKLALKDMDMDGGAYSSYGGGHKSNTMVLSGNQLQIKWSRCVACQTSYRAFKYFEFTGTKVE